jgi:hypothetical protein
MGFSTVMAMIFYQHAIPMGVSTVMDVIVCYRHTIPPGFLTVMDGIACCRHGIPGFDCLGEVFPDGFQYGVCG